MKFDQFLSHYNLDFLSDIDINIHEKMLNKYFSIFGKKENLVFFDVGSHAGSFIKTSYKYDNNIEIHAFEPHPFLSNYLRENYKNIKVNECCVSNQDGDCKINIPSLSVAISSIIDRDIFQELEKTGQRVEKIESKSIKVDTYCKENGIQHIDYIKLDVEGAEFFVFDGAKDLLKNGQISAGQFEIGIDESGYNTDDIISLLESFGYEIDKCSPSDYFFHKR
jgi:FkbM family methyltransferase